VRKVVAILFLLIICFNIVGYRYVFMVLSTKADSHLETQIDNFDYDESQLVEIRVDLNIPYQERYTEFERQYGEITIDGKPYTYVMRKMEGTVLILKCLHNIYKEKLKSSSDAITKANSNQDQDNNSQKQNSGLLKVIKSDYFGNNDYLILVSNQVINKINQFPSAEGLPEVSILPPHQPPRC
jgi:hypothetical protein